MGPVPTDGDESTPATASTAAASITAGYGPTIEQAPAATPSTDSNINPAIVVLPGDFSQDLTIDFGLINEQNVCIEHEKEGLIPLGKINWTVNVNGDVSVWWSQTTKLNDNSYGLNQVGWAAVGKSHTFGNLTGSDQARFEFKNAAGPNSFRSSHNVDRNGNLNPFGRIDP